MGPKTKTAYTPVLRREKKEDNPQGRREPGENPFEAPSLFWGRSLIFWIMTVVLISVIVAVILTIAFVFTSYPMGSAEDRYLNFQCLDTETMKEYNDVTFSDGSNDFARRLYHKLTSGPEENMVASPYSLYSVLTLLLTGAEEQTELTLKSVLMLPCNNDTLWMEIYRRFSKRLNVHAKTKNNHNNNLSGTDFTIESANQVFGDIDFEFTSEFIRTSVEYFGGPPQRLEFDKSDEAIQNINKWISQHTHGKIRDLLAPGSVGAQTRLVLVNAVYFRAGWLHPFEQNKTSNHSFALMSGGSMDVEMMELEADLLSVEVPNLNAKILKLPYFRNRAHMIIILPDEDAQISQVESTLFTDDSALKSLEDQTPTRTLVKLPKFRIESSHDLKATLQTLGLGNIFSSEADLSKISGRKDLAVDEVMQKAFIEVNELGTEAAAATAIISKSSIIDFQVQNEFICDRPFIFMIRDEETGLSLFEGKVVHPQEYEGIIQEETEDI